MDEVDEVFEGSVEMRLLLKANHLGEVNVIDVRVDAEETLCNWEEKNLCMYTAEA